MKTPRILVWTRTTNLEDQFVEGATVVLGARVRWAGERDRIVMMNEGSVHADYAGSHRRHIRAEDLIRRFDEICRDERLIVSAAELLRDAYV